MKININLKLFLILFLSFLFSGSFSQKKPLLNTKSIVTTFDSSKVDDGYILLMLAKTCSLIDRKGNVVFNIPGNLISFYANKPEVVTHNDNNLVVYDKDLDIIWKTPSSIEHELSVTPENNILFLSEECDSINNIRVYFNTIVRYDSAMNKSVVWSSLKQRRYLMDFMMKDTSIFHYTIKGTSDPDSVLYNIAPSLAKVRLIPIQMTSTVDSIFASGTNRELFHMNALQIIPVNKSEAKDNAFKSGNILLSFCNFNDSIASFMAIVDPVEYKILWHYVQKEGQGIHTPAMLPNGHILVYVNSSRSIPYSSVQEIDPLTKEVIWNYTENFPPDIARLKMGSCQRLPNENTIISNASGYVYEVTPEKEVIWQWCGTCENNSKHIFLYRALMYPREKVQWLLSEE